MIQLCWQSQVFFRTLPLTLSHLQGDLCVYGDPADPLRMHLQAPFRNAGGLTEQMELFNKSMSKVRMLVEWIFGDVINDL